MSAYSKPLPVVDARNWPFWAGTKAREVRLLQCKDCGHHRYQSFKICPACGAETSEWVKTSGRGTIWSFGVFHQVYFKGFAEEAPYTVVIVELEEGPRLYSNLVDVAAEDIRIGMPVEAVFEDATDEITLLKFKPRNG